GSGMGINSVRRAGRTGRRHQGSQFPGLHFRSPMRETTDLPSRRGFAVCPFDSGATGAMALLHRDIPASTIGWGAFVHLSRRRFSLFGDALVEPRHPPAAWPWHLRGDARLMTAIGQDTLGTRDTLKVGGKDIAYYSLK